MASTHSMSDASSTLPSSAAASAYRDEQNVTEELSRYAAAMVSTPVTSIELAESCS